MGKPLHKLQIAMDQTAMNTLKFPHPLHQSLTVHHLSVNYRGVEALRDICLDVQPGRLTGIIGPNGAGKSTLMKAMLGLVPMAAGSVVYDGKPLSQQRQRVAYVPQRSQIDWDYPATVWDIVMMGRVRKTGWLRPFSGVSRRIATQALERVGMAEFKNRPIGQLSGGQQQRVFLARSLAQEAEIFCFDEPFVGIDQKTEAVIFSLFRELAASGKIVIVINHDLGESIVNFDDLILINRELITAGNRHQVLKEDHLQQAYGGRVFFFAEKVA